MTFSSSDNLLSVPALLAKNPCDFRWNPNGAIVFDRKWGFDIRYERCLVLVPEYYEPKFEIKSGRKFLRMSAEGFGMTGGVDNYLPVILFEKKLFAYFDRDAETRILLEIKTSEK